MQNINDHRGLLAFRKAFAVALIIHHITKRFPPDEKFSLTDQIKRSSRSVCSNIAEAYRKRRYRNHFISKLSDADSENSETSVWIGFCICLSFIDQLEYDEMTTLNNEIGRILHFMVNNPEKFGVK